MSQYEKKELVDSINRLKHSKHDVEAFHAERDSLVFEDFFEMITRREDPLSHKDIIAIVKKIQTANKQGPKELWCA